MGEFEPVRIPGDEGWYFGYQMAQALDARFPNQQAEDFAYMLAHNQHPLGDTANVVDLICTQVGENDGGEWIWTVRLDDGRAWTVVAWCDYTGWDCQSGADWESTS